MVNILLACVIALLVTSLGEYVFLCIKIVEVWKLKEELLEFQAIEPIAIDSDGRWKNNGKGA